jgi:hypothetical protein
MVMPMALLWYPAKVVYMESAVAEVLIILIAGLLHRKEQMT